MIQAYCLSVIYLIVSALLFLVDSYRRALSPVILLKGLLIERRSALRIFMIAGLLIALLIILFPVSPGPVILGDFIPAFWIIYSAFFFHINYSAKSSEDEMMKEGLSSRILSDDVITVTSPAPAKNADLPVSLGAPV